MFRLLAVIRLSFRLGQTLRQANSQRLAIIVLA